MQGGGSEHGAGPGAPEGGANAGHGAPARHRAAVGHRLPHVRMVRLHESDHHRGQMPAWPASTLPCVFPHQTSINIDEFTMYTDISEAAITEPKNLTMIAQQTQRRLASGCRGGDVLMITHFESFPKCAWPVKEAHIMRIF